MKSILSLNIRGMGEPSKILHLWEMADEHCPSVILLQETLCTRLNVVGDILPFCHGWKATSIDSVGRAAK